MGHVVNADRAYRLLQQRLDRTVTGAPDSPLLMRILELLFTPEEADLARQLPGRPTSLPALSRKLNVPEEALAEKLTILAQRGVVLDIEHKGQRYYLLPPIVVGFFEFTFMRTREDLPMAELAKLFHAYMSEEDRFAHSVFQGQTQVGRSLVREEALPEDDHTEILDWERATWLVESARAVGVGICPCRHKAGHLGKACDAPQRVCLTLNYGAETLIRSGVAERLTNEEGVRILEQCEDAGLAQIGDNVQRNVTYICNCCGCCCGQLQAIRTFDIRNAVVSSNWIMVIDEARCKGCGKCVKACPIGAIAVNGEPGARTAKVESALCLGCGVCYRACKTGALTMKPRAQRVLTPEGIYDRVVAMAIERGKLADLIFETPDGIGHRALGRIFAVLEKSPPFKAAMAIKPLRSAFLNAMLKRGVQR